MNEIVMTGNDLLIFGIATAVCFILGALFKLRCNVLRQRCAVELGERDLKVLADRCERQQLGMTRLNQELTDMRQAMLQQALAIMPARPVMQTATPEPAAAPVKARVQQKKQEPVRPPAPAGKPKLKAVPSSAPAAPKAAVPKPAVADSAQLARAGAGVDVLMNRCGLSRVEAELVVSVHGVTCAPRKHGT